MSEPNENRVDLARVLNDLFAGGTLSRERAREIMESLMTGAVSHVQAAALLAALRTRGETVEEITGFAEAMRKRAVRVTVELDEPLVDTCGTGGTGIGTFNVSTTTAFVAAGAGARVAKHGNRALTRSSGAADVLEALGANLDVTPEAAARLVERHGVAFLFARNHHPAMRFVAPIRAELRARTVFNSLGPLTNPAGAKRQLLGVYDPALPEVFANVLRELGSERALVVHGDGLDELTVTGPSHVAELAADGTVRTYDLAPEDVGLRTHPLEELLGGTPAKNAITIRRVLAGEERGAKRDIVLLNAGAALYVAGLADGIREGVGLAARSIDGGKALERLERFLEATRA